MFKYPWGTVFRIPQGSKHIWIADSRSDEDTYETLSKVKNFVS